MWWCFVPYIIWWWWRWWWKKYINPLSYRYNIHTIHESLLFMPNILSCLHRHSQWITFSHGFFIYSRIYRYTRTSTIHYYSRILHIEINYVLKWCRLGIIMDIVPYGTRHTDSLPALRTTNIQVRDYVVLIGEEEASAYSVGCLYAYFNCWILEQAIDWWGEGGSKATKLHP